ncbi:MAG TPA: hypothetical protein VNG89_04555, partial [Vicinamibacterales bacterium]|nr:hypothetical protein [Vicinamibacterales bacterium]
MTTVHTDASDASDRVSLGDEQQVVDVVGGSILKLWQAVNDLTRLTPTRRRARYRVTIFGSARVPRDHWVYGAVRDVAADLA